MTFDHLYSLFLNIILLSFFIAFFAILFSNLFVSRRLSSKILKLDMDIMGAISNFSSQIKKFATEKPIAEKIEEDADFNQKIDQASEDA